jgi:hypothetical protein
MEVKTMNAMVVMMRTAHRRMIASIDSGNKPMHDLIRPATFDVGIMTDIQDPSSSTWDLNPNTPCTVDLPS